MKNHFKCVLGIPLSQEWEYFFPSEQSHKVNYEIPSLMCFIRASGDPGPSICLWGVTVNILKWPSFIFRAINVRARWQCAWNLLTLNAYSSGERGWFSAGLHVGRSLHFHRLSAAWAVSEGGAWVYLQRWIVFEAVCLDWAKYGQATNQMTTFVL